MIVETGSQLSADEIGALGNDACRAEAFRVAKARQWFDLGVGQELGMGTFERYLATVPSLPKFPWWFMGIFNRLVLVEGRLTIEALCRISGIKRIHVPKMLAGGMLFITMRDDEMGSEGDMECGSGVRWMWCHDGRRNNGRKSCDCLMGLFHLSEVPLVAVEGVSLYVDDPSVIKEHEMILPCSVNVGPCSGGVSHVSLTTEDGQPSLRLRPFRYASPDAGVAFRILRT